jgi:hypothetical protein
VAAHARTPRGGACRLAEAGAPAEPIIDPMARSALQSEPRIEVHRRADSGRWELLEAHPGGTTELASLGARLDGAAVYANPHGGAATA